MIIISITIIRYYSFYTTALRIKSMKDVSRCNLCNPYIELIPFELRHRLKTRENKFPVGYWKEAPADNVKSQLHEISFYKNEPYSTHLSAM